jgi:hypothetical protein
MERIEDGCLAAWFGYQSLDAGTRYWLLVLQLEKANVQLVEIARVENLVLTNVGC